MKHNVEVIEVGTVKYSVLDAQNMKAVNGPDYNYLFSKKSGSFVRFGKTRNDDPDFSPIGPEIADIEITTACNGINGKLCAFCYKSNTQDGTYMTFDTFKIVFKTFPKSLTQIAFGVDSECKTNPDTFKIMEYARENGVIPNLTISNISDETAEKLSKVCGAVAVSRYEDKNFCYDSVKKLTDRGMDQVNIHIMVSDQSYESVMETLRDRLTDPRLAKLNAIVLLGLKKKGRGKKFEVLSFEKFQTIVSFALTNNISIGFDSCSAFKFLKSLSKEDYDKYFSCVDPCESFCFSIYVNVDGRVFPCSFTEDEGICGWENGIDLFKVTNFLNEVWYNPQVLSTRDNIIAARKSEKGCFHYEI